MAEFAQEIRYVNIEEELRQSYLDYAMSVIVGRALPDVRDGLKPVHRRVLYAMRELGNDWNRAYKKSARVVGDVIGKYHPHGETAVYDAIVRMAQPFSMREMLVDGQGNFGSVDGDSPAAMRYTEIRMSRIAHELLADLEKETVDFLPNYDGSEREPTVLPTRLPNLLVNGSAGIAVGMATNVPPHNAGEVLGACIAYLDDSDIGIDGLMGHLPGPDFPTGASINGAAGIREAYHTGRGRIHIRAAAHVEEGEGNERARVVFTEIPYQVNKARLVEKIADLVRARKLEGIAELRDESDKDGIRVVVEVRRDAVPEVLLNRLYRHTQFETVFGINMVALVNGQPRTLNLKQIIRGFIRHRREVVTRRTIFDLRRARARAHVLEGLAVALANIDAVIELIRGSANPAEARAGLTARLWEPGMVTSLLEGGGELTRPEDEGAFGIEPGDGGTDGYRLSSTQAQAILDMRLHRLTGLEQDKIVNEFKDLVERIKNLVEILDDPDRLLSVIREELVEVRNRFGTDPRRTVIESSYRGFDREDLVTPEDVAVTLSYAGYVKARPLGEYRAQRRGGRGRMATRTKQEDFVDRLFIAHTHDTLLCFSDRGIGYWLKVYEIPQAGAGSRGTPIVNLLPLADGERISAVLPVSDFAQGGYVFMATRAGIVKKTALAAFSRPAQRRHHRGASRYGRLPRWRGAYRRRTRSHALLERRQGDPLPGAGRAGHGPDLARGPRHAARRRGAGHLPHRRRSGRGALGNRERFRQAHSRQRLPPPAAGREGAHRHQDVGAKRRCGGGAARRAGRRDRADLGLRHPRAHRGGGDPRGRAQHAGRPGHPAGPGTAPGEPRSRRRGQW